MAVEDWQTTAADNTTVGPVNIAEGCPAANMNNMGREMMAQIAAWRDELGDDYQGKDATLTAIAGLTTAADQLIYATGADTFAMTALTAFARTLLSSADATAAANTLGVVRVSSFYLNYPNGYIEFQFGAQKFRIAYGLFTAAANGVTNVTYYSPFTSFSLAVVSGVGEQSPSAQDNNPGVISTSIGGFQVYNASNSANTFYIACGV